jgi:predicted transcriptional regulator
MSKGTPKRSIRIDDELWDRATEVAAKRDENLSAIIRKALENYINEQKANHGHV